MQVLITGASSGIGLELAKIFAANNYDLILVARNIEELEILSQTWSVRTLCISCDLSKINNVKNLVQQLEGQVIDIVINNAGFGDYGSLIDLEPDRQIEMINLNISALTYISQIFARQMSTRQTGKILNIASIAAYLPGPLMATYYASKAYVLSFSYALAEELRDTGVQVSVACPGPTSSKFGSKAGVNHTAAFSHAMPATKVAQIVYKDLLRGKQLIVTGVKNQILIALLRLLPTKLSARINYWLLK